MIETILNMTLLLMWFISVMGVCFIFNRKNMPVSFWAIVILITPILNTIYCIKYHNKETKSFKDIWNDKL